MQDANWDYCQHVSDYYSYYGMTLLRDIYYGRAKFKDVRSQGDKIMAKQTIQQRLIAALKAEGYAEIQSNSRKYVTMSNGSSLLYFVGKAGALRRGTCATKSIPVDGTKRRLLGK